jgi:hypothetical protein
MNRVVGGFGDDGILEHGDLNFDSYGVVHADAAGATRSSL